MNPVYLRKAIAGASIILGLWMLWAVVVYPLFRFGAGGKTPFDYLFFVPMSLLMGFPGVLWSFFGLKLFREMSETSLRWILGTFTVVAAFWIAAQFSVVFPTLLPQGPLYHVGLTLGALIALPAYLFSLRALLPMLGSPKRRALHFLGRGTLLVLAWNIFFLLSSLFDAHNRSKFRHEASAGGDDGQVLQEAGSTLLGLAVSVGVAYGFFRASQHVLSRWRRREEAQPAPLQA